MIVLAFSLQSDVKSIGAYAGFAAIIGLALLVLLYFAQAREIRRLSDWLDEQENRLRAAPARPLIPRPGSAAAERAVVATPAATPVAVAQEAGAATAATVAVPGVRRVAVGPGGAVGVAGTAAPVAADAADTSPPGAVSAATVAGAMAAASAAGQAAAASPGGAVDADGEAASPVAEAANEGSIEDAPREADTGGEPPPGADAPAAAGAVPLSASPAATAEPVGAAQTLGAAPGAESGGLSSDTAESAIVDVVEPDSGGAVATLDSEAGVARFAPPPPPPPPGGLAPFGTRPDDAAAPFEPDAGVEISAERIAPDAFHVPLPAPSAEEAEAPADVADDEPPVLAPSTAAGARPRFPPPPVAARATPVGATARVGAEDAAAETALGAEAATTTRRRGQERPPPGAGDGDGDLGHHSPGSLLRLAAAAVVIVLVLIFIATRVFAPSKTTGLSPAKVNVAVLNGTPVAGLAGQVAVKLKADGFLQDGIANALSHGHHVTLVGYTPGHLAAAKLVAKDLGATTTLVGPIDARTLAVAEALSTTPPNVIVTLGSDYLRR